VSDIGVVLVVLPGDREFFGTKTSGGPKNQEIDIILSETINRLLPFCQSYDRHPHESDVITAQFEGFRARRADAYQTNEQNGPELHEIHLSGILLWVRYGICLSAQPPVAVNFPDVQNRKHDCSLVFGFVVKKWLTMRHDFWYKPHNPYNSTTAEVTATGSPKISYA
jgi:hypothetical protein